MKLFKLITCILFLYLFITCKNYHKEKVSVLMLIKEESIFRDSNFVYDSIKVFYDNDVRIVKYKKNQLYETDLKYKDSDLVELRELYENFEDKYLRTDTVLMFSKEDTTFNYFFPIDNILLVSQYSFTDCKYDIKESAKPGERISLIQSLIDTTYTEMYYYNNDYTINKIIHTWQGNKCTYVLE